MRYENHLFENDTVTIDGNEFHHCEFRNCRILLTGESGKFDMHGIRMTNCQFGVSGKVVVEVNFLKALYANARPIAEPLLKDLLKSITGKDIVI